MSLDEPLWHVYGKQRPQRFPNTSRHSGNTEKVPVTSPRGLPGPTVLGRGRRADDSHGAEGSPKRMSRRTKSNRGPGDTKLRSERPNRAKPTLEAPSLPNVRSYDGWRY
ncbi:hypothetical protein CRG98_030018 [Punica granatum]|uniref:Uncharacterized protein n=1 Tax=Punica granatum TaxID=22663 RepID=A0A2I0J040_PUNGR|nr:hypothetical protein CRG98_030018 [Punica granatum]